MHLYLCCALVMLAIGAIEADPLGEEINLEKLTQSQQVTLDDFAVGYEDANKAGVETVREKRQFGGYGGYGRGGGYGGYGRGKGYYGGYGGYGRGGGFGGRGFGGYGKGFGGYGRGFGGYGGGFGGYGRGFGGFGR